MQSSARTVTAASLLVLMQVASSCDDDDGANLDAGRDAAPDATDVAEAPVADAPADAAPDVSPVPVDGGDAPGADGPGACLPTNLQALASAAFSFRGMQVVGRVTRDLSSGSVRCTTDRIEPAIATPIHLTFDGMTWYFWYEGPHQELVIPASPGTPLGATSTVSPHRKPTTIEGAETPGIPLVIHSQDAQTVVFREAPAARQLQGSRIALCTPYVYSQNQSFLISASELSITVSLHTGAVTLSHTCGIHILATGCGDALRDVITGTGQLICPGDRPDAAPDAPPPDTADAPPADVPPDAPCVGDCKAPRPIAPLSTSAVSSRTPLLRWRPTLPANGAQLRLCRDRALSTACQSVLVSGDSHAVPAELAPGVWFWQLQAPPGDPTVTAGPIWWFTVPARTTPTRTSWRSTLDLDGDGHADFVRDVSYKVGGGTLYVHRGGSGGVAPTASQTLLAPVPRNGDGFGENPTSAGDVNGDGYAELVFSARGPDDTPRVLIHHGGPGQLATAPNTTLTLPDVPTMQAFPPNFGARLAAAGDLDGDGYGDLVVSAPGLDGLGRVYLYLGGPSGLATTPAGKATGQLPNPAMPAQVLFGSSLSASGDITGDGLTDLALGSDTPFALIRLYVGSPGGVGGLLGNVAGVGNGMTSFRVMSDPADFNADGYSDLAALERAGPRLLVYQGRSFGLAADPSTIINPPPSDQFEVGGPLMPTGDFNGDGYADLALPGILPSGMAGPAFVYLGGANGLGTTPNPRLFGAPANAKFRYPMTAADFNRDGFDDLIISGTTIVDDVERPTSFVFPGSAAGIPATPSASLIYDFR